MAKFVEGSGQAQFSEEELRIKFNEECDFDRANIDAALERIAAEEERKEREWRNRPRRNMYYY